ncbi:MAG: ABC transporter ATP-binding protein [Candidatus Hydrothermarchaeota archaeon]|nr:MAG: ABC transporter ATP-binding protein [Candidatus Hydrothermarchaeota archaeon]
MIRAESISMIYKDGTIALEGVSFSIAKGESCSVIGPSGCGKTTLLFILSGLLKPTEGEILINSKNIALILQDYGLFPWKTVYENVSLGLEIRGVKKEEQRKIVLPLLEKLGLKGFENHYPRQLSGGMQQRVAFARALALNPEVLLMDEPFSSLDALTREKLQNFLLKLWINNKVTMVLVTHSIEEAVFLGRKIVVLSQRPGRVLKIIDNPEMGSLDYRNREEFFEKCREVRKSIEEKGI